MKQCGAFFEHLYILFKPTISEFSGHKGIDNILIYIQSGKSLFQNIHEGSFIIHAAHDLEEAAKLGEVGFEPFVVMDGVQLFRKRK